jgi:hypothetical protein
MPSFIADLIWLFTANQLCGLQVDQMEHLIAEGSLNFLPWQPDKVKDNKLRD